MVPYIYPWYYISNFGNVYSSYSNKILKPGIDSKGYPYVALSTEKGPKNQRIHRLVMLAFDYHEGCENEIINHVTGIKHNPKIWNLEWSNYSNNVKHAIDMGLISNPGSKGNISDEDIKKVCELLVEGKYTAKEIASIVGTSVDTVYSINTGKAHNRISKEYNLINRKMKMNEQDVRNICLYFQNNPRNGKLKNDYIIEALNYYGIEINTTTLNAGERILYKQSYKNIIKDYNY